MVNIAEFKEKKWAERENGKEKKESNKVKEKEKDKEGGKEKGGKAKLSIKRLTSISSIDSYERHGEMWESDCESLINSDESADEWEALKRLVKKR
uniref:Uncharacterized protein n=1 Tax=Chromera velia CCMP2878 TaxID=1169474 RepID=A0A0G4FK90_9ALVE|eukprot:Cvel_17457.t1-p1 / transcript=Cvel_17457.t1 / gene=Cvel_17457 / organism=Chromera_velia_CCMP2878 / gene_product=hypothetical protein / transcript_product=hypothetical protein / location=Cvel_scaffold1394:4574-4855(-) / protein_length=94 / sequence_SO=supercontig / SO=protein_coding / is_pseudo=false